MRFGIPKEIKAKPKLLGLELKELAIIGLIIVFSLTVFGEMIHKIFVIPFYIVVGLSVLYLFSPSSANPKKKNYHSILLWARRDRGKYHAININQYKNKRLLTQTIESNKELVKAHKIHGESIGSLKETVSLDKVEKIKEADNSTKQTNTLEDLEIKKSISNPREVEKSVVAFRKKDVKPLNELGEKEGTRNQTEEVEKQVNENQEKQHKRHKRHKNKELGISKKVKEQSKRLLPSMIRQNVNHLKIWIVVAIFITVASVFMFVKLDLLQLTNNEFSEEEKQEEQEDANLVYALRSFSLKNYDEAMNHFDEVDYESLSDDDKDVMLLSYLFGRNAEKALALEPDFDETVASYYKATRDMQKIRDLSEKVDSKVLDFEVAVDDRNLERIVELKDFVKIKDNRDEIILEAMLELDDLEGAKEFVSKNETEKLTVMVTEYEKEKKNKSKKKGD